MNRGERQEWISSMYGRVREINESKENKERNIRIKQLNSEATFMHYSNLLNGTEYRRMINKISFNEEKKSAAKEKDASYRMLSFYNNILLELYTKARNIYEDNDFYYHNNIRFNEKEFEDAFVMFLDYLNVRDLYDSIKNNHMLMHGASKIKKGQRGICLPHDDLSYIILGQTKKDHYEYYIDLIYEIAIAFINNVLHSNKLTFDEYKCYYYFIPPLFCRIFFEFLMKNKVFDVTKIRLIRANNEVLNYEKLVSAYDVCSYIERKCTKISDAKTYENMIKRVDHDISPMIQQEAIGLIASCKLLGDYKEDPEEFIKDLSYIIKKIKKLDFSKLLNTYCNLEALEETVNENFGKPMVKKKS